MTGVADTVNIFYKPIVDIFLADDPTVMQTITFNIFGGTVKIRTRYNDDTEEIYFYDEETWDGETSDGYMGVAKPYITSAGKIEIALQSSLPNPAPFITKDVWVIGEFGSLEIGDRDTDGQVYDTSLATLMADGTLYYGSTIDGVNSGNTLYNIDAPYSYQDNVEDGHWNCGSPTEAQKTMHAEFAADIRAMEFESIGYTVENIPASLFDYDIDRVAVKAFVLGN